VNRTRQGVASGARHNRAPSEAADVLKSDGFACGLKKDLLILSKAGPRKRLPSI